MAEQHETRKAQRGAGDRHQGFFEHAPIGMFRCTRIGRFAAVNAALVRLLGYPSPKAVLALRLPGELYSDQEQWIRVRTRYEAGEVLSGVDLQWIKQDGTPLRVQLYGWVIRDTAGRVVSYEGAVLDRTAEKEVETALQESERRYRSVVENANDAIATFTLDSTITSVNRGAEILLGWSREELIGEPYRTVSSPDLAALADARTRSFLAGEKLPSLFEGELVRKDGTLVPVEARTRVIRDAAGNPLGFQGIFRDISERKRIEAAVQESEEQYRTLVETAREVIYVLALDGTLASFNPAFEEVTGWSRAEWQGKPFPPILHPDDVPTAMDLFQRTLQGERLSFFELRIRARSGAYLTGEFSATPQVRDGKVVSVLGVARNVTDRKRVEAELQANKRLLEKIADTLPDIVYLYDLVHAHLRYVNQKLLSVLGHRPEAVQGQRGPLFGALMHSDDTPRLSERLSRLATAADGDLLETEFRLRHANGEWRWLCSREMVFARTEDGAPAQVLGMARDVTQHKRFAQDLGKWAIQKQALGERLREFRDGLGLSQGDFGERFGGYSQRQISLYEKGDAELPLALLLTLRERGYPLEYILGTGPTTLVDETVRYLSASQGERLMAKQLAEALVHTLAREHQLVEHILRELDIPAKGLAREQEKLLEQLAALEKRGGTG